MSDPHNHVLPHPSSPTNSSLSSSDLDTESTASFFHDRSTTLGTLMGVTFPPFTTPSHRLVASSAPSLPKPKKKKPSFPPERRRRPWWTLCGDGASKPASLGEFLEVERRFGDGGGYDVASSGVNGRVLFADGRVLPPAVENREESGSLCGFPVMLSGICSGCVG